jgi:hypothetical protein
MDERNYEQRILFPILSQAHWSLYMRFSEELAKYKITLVVIEPQDLSKLPLHKREHLLLLSSDLASLKALKQLRHRFLDFCLKARKVVVYHATSFDVFSDLQALPRTGLYHKYELPVKIKVLCYQVATEYYGEIRQSASWPGGKRAKLPTA